MKPKDWLGELFISHQMLITLMLPIVGILFMTFVFSGAFIQFRNDYYDKQPLISAENKNKITKKLNTTQFDKKKCKCTCK